LDKQAIAEEYIRKGKMRKIYDLTIPMEDSPSEPLPAKVVHEEHKTNAAVMGMLFGASDGDLPLGLGWATDTVTLGSHTGTHVDAPWHYFPTSEGKRARTIDEIPLDWFYHDGVVLDMRFKSQGSGVTIQDIKDILNKIHYKLKEWDIVMVQTGADKLWGKKEYFDAGCGMQGASTAWLIDQGIRVMGIDAWGWDRPFWAIKEEYEKSKNRSVIWEAHRVGINKEYCHIEKLANLDRLPEPFGFKVACFPIKLTGGSAGWSRVVAIYNE
jgi:kynurenine formamidase